LFDFNKPTFKDDLISVIYILIYLLERKLPWSNPPTHKLKEAFVWTRKMKFRCFPDEICFNRSRPFEKVLSYCYSLDDRFPPDYDYVEKKIAKILAEALKTSKNKEEALVDLNFLRE